MDDLTRTWGILLVNEKLERVYGRHVDVPQALYRIVWANDQIEKRKSDVTEAGIVLPYGSVIREVPKYWYLQDQYVLEKLVPNIHQDVEGSYIYDPLFPFDFVPTFEACAHVIKSWQTTAKRLKSEWPQNQYQADQAEQRHLNKEKARTKNLFDNTALVSALHDGDAAVVPGLRDEIQQSNKEPINNASDSSFDNSVESGRA